MATPSQEFATLFYYNIGGDIYSSFSNPSQWFVSFLGKFYNEDGLRNKECGKEVSNIEIMKIYQTLSVSRKKEISYLVDNIFQEQEIIYQNSVITELLDLFPFYSEVEPYNGRTTIFLDKRTNKRVFLKTVDEYNVNESVSYVVLLYRMLSHLGYAPKVYHSGILTIENRKTGYIISQYIPITIQDILEKEPSRRKEITILVNKLIENLKYLNIHNLDIHSENFLFDPLERKVYAIDFDNTTLNKNY